LDSGQVSINGHGSGAQPHLPFGGHKWSGVGVENGIWGLHSFTDTQVVTGSSRRRIEEEGTASI
jgi:acyl-CoA reductase-like NAD-dependent aldehyde dehydrogenase